MFEVAASVGDDCGNILDVGWAPGDACGGGCQKISNGAFRLGLKPSGATAKKSGGWIPKISVRHFGHGKTSVRDMTAHEAKPPSPSMQGCFSKLRTNAMNKTTYAR
jgi:hypothetical protein